MINDTRWLEQLSVAFSLASVHKMQVEGASATDDVLTARMDSAKILTTLLGSVSYRKDQLCLVQASSTGLKVTTEEAGAMQGNAFVKRELFSEYELQNTASIKFRVNLTVLLECLNIFGAAHATAVCLRYAALGEPLVLMLEESGVVTDCSLATLEAEPTLHFRFLSSPSLTRVLVQSDSLKDAFAELDWSSRDVTLSVSTNPPVLRITAESVAGSCEVEMPGSSRVFESFECSAAQRFTYRLALLQPAFKALAMSRTTSLRINLVGVLCLQHMIATDKTVNWIEFFLLPVEDELETEAY